MDLGHVPGLDGLRGAAVVAVVAYHLDLVPGGFLGVDVFFVLSGFLITSLLVGELERTGRVDVRTFWRRRVRRLVPAVLVMVPVVIVVAMVIGWPRTRLDDLALDGFATLTWWANWRQAGGASYWATDSPNLFRHAWSLAVEEQFYLLWPPVVLAAAAWARRAGRSIVAAVGVTAAVGFVVGAVWMAVSAQRLGAGGLGRVYVGTDTRVLGPLAGCALACWWQRTAARRLRGPSAAPGSRSGSTVAAVGATVGSGVLVWAFLTAQVSDPVLYGGGFVVATLASVVVIASLLVAHEDPQPRWAGSTSWTSGRVLRYLGLRSYGIYLWSWPLQLLAERRFESMPRPALVVGVVVVSLVVAEASFRWVEEPVRSGRWAQRTRPTPRMAWSAAAAVALVPVVAAMASADPAPAHEGLAAEDALAVALAEPAPSPTDAPPAPDPEPEPEPLGPVLSAGPWRVMLFGDSVALTAGYNLARSDRPLPDAIADVDNRALLGCGVLAIDGWQYWLGEPDGWVDAGRGLCARQAEAEELGLSANPDVVLGMPGAWEHVAARPPGGARVEPMSEEMTDAVRAGLVERSRRVHERGGAFALVAWACPGPESLPERRDPAYVDWVNAVIDDAVAEAVSLGHDAFVIDVTDAVCEGAVTTASQTPERAAATGGEFHLVDPDGADWFWHDWITPALVELAAATD